MTPTPPTDATATGLKEAAREFMFNNWPSWDSEFANVQTALEEMLAALLPSASVGEPEDAAWTWLDSKFLNVEAGDDPNDRSYSADEMVDAFIAGQASLSPPTDAEREPLGILRCAVRRILARCEAVEDENSDQLGKDQTEASSGFLRGERSLAKSIRRELHDLTRRALAAPETPPTEGEGK